MMEIFEGKMKLVSDPAQLERIEASVQKIYDALEGAGLLGSRFVGVKAFLKEYERIHGVKISRQTIYARVRRGQLEAKKDGGTLLIKID